jgi:diacylglycerol kinase (ATP)
MFLRGICANLPPTMRVAAILGKTASDRDLRDFQSAAATFEILPDLPAVAAFDAALIFGGDGSIHRQLAALVATQTPALLLPTGSGNDFARSLGLNRHSRSLAAWKRFCSSRDNVRAVDLARISADGDPPLGTRNSLYCCIAGVGLDSEVNRRANGYPTWLRGHGGYALAVLPELRSFRAPHITIELDGAARISEPAMLAAFANAPAYGHGIRMAPSAQLDDGLLDVCFVRRVSKLKLLTVFPLVYFGAHTRLREVEYRQTPRLHVASDPPIDIFGDGEFICRTPAEIKVQPRALRVIVP